MTRVEVFDPPMCCSTGVCGPRPEDHLARFSADLKWLADQGVEVRRYNLAQEPAAFMANPQVKRIVAETAGDGLPIVIVDGRVVSQQDYPSRDRLAALVGCAGGDQAAVGAQRHATAEDSPYATGGQGGCCGGSGASGCC